MKKRIPVYLTTLLLCLASFHAFSQSVTSCTPDTSTRGTTLNVTISGVGLNMTSVSPTSVELMPSAGGTMITTSSITATGANTANFNVNIPVGADVGDYDIKILPNMSTYSLSRFYVSSFYPSLSSCVPNVSPPGTTLSVTLTGVGLDFMSASPTSVQLIPVAGGSNITSTSVSATSSNTAVCNLTIPSGATLGDYNVQVLPNMPFPTPSLFTVNSTSPGTTGIISGHIFLDENSNCVQDGAEVDFNGCTVGVFPDSLYILTDPNGNYTINMVPGSYTIDAYPKLHQTRLCPTGPIPVTISAPGTTDSGNDFVMDYEHVTDAVIHCWLGDLRPGFLQTHNITVSNVGYFPLNGEVKFVMDPLLTYVSSVPAGTLTGSTVTWTISPAIPPGGTRTYAITTSVPVGTPLFTFVHCESYVIPTTGDITPADDSTFCEGPVIGSYDPNDKTVWDQDMNPADPFIDLTDSILYYRIRFQNTGTASAINIFIRDTLDPYLDAATLETVGYSHSPCTYSLNGSGNLEWRFAGIELPDSNSDEPGSHGFVAYKVRIRPGFSLGAFITNKASIYFDFNEPVVTNETFSSITVSAADPSGIDPVRAYPVPASGILHIEMPCTDSQDTRFALLSQLGTVITSTPAACTGLTTRGELNLSGISPGVYLLETTSGKSRLLKKIVILR